MYTKEENYFLCRYCYYSIHFEMCQREKQHTHFPIACLNRDFLPKKQIELNKSILRKSVRTRLFRLC